MSLESSLALAFIFFIVAATPGSGITNTGIVKVLKARRKFLPLLPPSSSMLYDNG
jgi:hypothetical protein